MEEGMCPAMTFNIKIYILDVSQEKKKEDAKNVQQYIMGE